MSNGVTGTRIGAPSPIQELLDSLGMTREDLSRHSEQMRKFLTAENANSLRALEHSQEIVPPRPISRSASSSTQPSFQSRPTSAMDPVAQTIATPPLMPPPATLDAPALLSSENLARHSEQLVDRDRDRGREAARKHKEREQRRMRAVTSSSPTATRPKPSLDMIMQMRSRESRRVPLSEESEDSDGESLKDVFGSRQQSSSKPSSSHYHHPPSSKPNTNASTSTAHAARSRSYYRQYKDPSPTTSSGGKYYRERVLTPYTYGTEASHSRQHSTETSNQRQAQMQTLLDFQVQSQAPQPAQYSTQTITPKKPISIPSYRRSIDDALPPSSPVMSSSPPFMSSSPAPVNFVSSPARFDSDPAESTDKNLPFTLPSGPFSTEKPDISYAALIGRAILASPQHKLRLKDIYDYISIAFPFYKREGHSHSQKWMNAIRQNLTNTPQFFKEVHPDGTSKGSLWCIATNDLPCFADGGYNRHALSPNVSASVAAKAEKRKRKREEEQLKMESKRVHLMAAPASAFPNPYQFPYGFATNGHMQLIPPPGHGYFMEQQPMGDGQNPDIIFPPLPASHPNAHLVNGPHHVVESTDDDANVIFPPLPAYSQTRLAREARLREMATHTLASSQSAPGSDTDSTPPTAPPSSAASSFQSVPALTPNDKSSSPSGGDDELEMLELAYPEDDEVHIQDNASPTEEIVRQIDTALLRPGKGKNRAVEESFEPVITVTAVPHTCSTPKGGRFPMQSTRPVANTASLNATVADGESEAEEDEEQLAIQSRPSTPPNKSFSVTFNTSLMRTPVAAKTPTRSSVRFKPPTVDCKEVVTDDGEKPKPVESESDFRTPSRKPATSSLSTNLTTPRGFLSPATWGFSPFRTPSRRHTLDPADPRSLLDDELAALASASARRGLQDSPIGFFERGKGLLYESPSLPSPSHNWRPW